MNGITLREEPCASDAAAIRAIVESTGMFYAAEIAIAEELVTERLAKGIASGYLFVFADRGEAPVGYACYGPIDGTEHSYDLFWIAVAQAEQRHGLGRLLLAEVERRIAEFGGGRVYIETSGRAQYAPTRAFYERHGYTCEAVLRDFYAPGDDKLIYVKAVAG